MISLVKLSHIIKTYLVKCICVPHPIITEDSLHYSNMKTVSCAINQATTLLSATPEILLRHGSFLTNSSLRKWAILTCTHWMLIMLPSLPNKRILKVSLL